MKLFQDASPGWSGRKIDLFIIILIFAKIEVYIDVIEYFHM